MENPEGVVGEIHRVLKGDGRAYFSTPVSGVRFLPRADDYTRLLHERWGHRRVYSREELIQLLEEGGFTVLRLSDYMHLTSRLFLYAYYMTVALAGRMDARAVRLSEKILYQASKLDSKIAFWSAFNTMAEAEKN